MKDHFDLRFSTLDFDHSPQRKFKFDDSCALESDFVPELGTAIAAIAVAMAFPNARNSPTFAARVLESAAAKLSKLVEDAHLFHAVDRGTVLHAYGLLESIIGAHYGDDVRLDRAVATLRSATVELDRARVPRSWAQAQNTLGVALGRYSDQRVGTDLLREAESALQAALSELDAEHAPSERAKALHHLGLIQTRIGARESSTENLTNAVASFRQALKLVQGGPRVAAIVENSLASALIGLGTRNGDDGCLEEALALTSNSVDLFELSLNAYGWTVSMIAYADAARALGVRRGSVRLIKEALRAFRLVSRVKTRKRSPQDWLELQLDFGMTLMELGKLDEGTLQLRQVETVICPRLDETRRSRDPLLWASAQHTLGSATLELGKREDSILRFEQAEKAFRSALEEFTPDRAPHWWATARFGLASSLVELGAQGQGGQYLAEAEGAFREVAEYYTRVGNHDDTALAMNGVAMALLNKGRHHEMGTESLNLAISTFKATLKLKPSNGAPPFYRQIERNWLEVLYLLRERSGAGETDGPES